MKPRVLPKAVYAAALIAVTSFAAHAGPANTTASHPEVVGSEDVRTAVGQQPASTQKPSDSHSAAAAHAGVAASVNGVDIPLSQVAALALRQAGPGITDQLIGNVLVDQEAQKQGLAASPAEIDAAADVIRSQVQPATLEDALARRHMTMEAFRDEMRVQVEVRKLLSKSLKPVRMAHISAILINIAQPGNPNTILTSQHTESQARTIMAQIEAQLKAGKPFEDLARQYSEDMGNKDAGGDIGIVSDIPYTEKSPAARAFSAQPAFLDAALGLKTGEYTPEPVKTCYGLHLIKADSTGDNHPPTEDQLYSDAETEATNDQLASLAPEYVSSLRQSANVVVYLGTAVPGPPGVAASVNGQNIPDSVVSETALQTAGATIADRLIINTLVDQEARKQGVQATPSEIDEKIDEIRNQIKPQTLENALEQTHMDVNDLREIQRVRVEAEKLVGKTIGPVRMVHVRHIVILVKGVGSGSPSGRTEHTEDKARAIIAAIQRELKAGKKFGDLATQYSEDSATKKSGGDLGVLTPKSPLEPSVLTAALALRRGQITPKAIVTSYGLELIEAVSTGDDPLSSDRQLYLNTEKQTRDREIQAEMHDYIPGLMARSHVSNFLAEQ